MLQHKWLTNETKFVTHVNIVVVEGVLAAHATFTHSPASEQVNVQRGNGMSRETYQQLVKYEELEAIICTQMHAYLTEGKGVKAMKLLKKIRRRMHVLCQATSCV